MKIVRPKVDLDKVDQESFRIFLAGGMLRPWRLDVIKELEKNDFAKNLTVIDPTLKNWEKEIGEENISNEPYVIQTDWEHKGLEISDVQVFHFDKATAQPITLFELGRFLDKESIMFLEDGYDYESYVEYIALRFNVPIVRTMKELIGLISIKYHSQGRNNNA